MYQQQQTLFFSSFNDFFCLYFLVIVSDSNKEPFS